MDFALTFFAGRVGDDVECSIDLANRTPPDFSMFITFKFDASQRIEEHVNSVFEIQAVFALVLGRFFRIPFEAQR